MSGDRREPHAALAFLPAALLLLAAVAASPEVLGRFVPLDWRCGDVRPAARMLQAALLALGLAAAVGRRRIAAACAAAFPTRREILVAAGLSTGALLAFGAIAEGSLRLAGMPFRARWTPSENALARFDPEIGWTYIPDRSHLRPFGRERRMVPIHFDSIGARVASPGAAAAPGAPTVVLVGCSYTFGHGLPYEETFAGRLAADRAFPFQVVNLGVQGYGTDQALLLLRRHFDRWNVRAVVYTFLEDHAARNDNDDRRLLYPDGRFLGTKPLFGLARDGGAAGGARLFMRRPPRRYEEIGSLRLWDWMRLVWTQNGPLPDRDLTRALVAEMRRFVESRGARFLVVNWDQRIDDRTFLPYPPGQGRIGLLQGLGLDILDTRAEAPAGWDDWTIPGDPHPDARAHARVGGMIAQRLATPLR